VKDENATTWLIPKLVGEVKFTEWTSESEMRTAPLANDRGTGEADTTR